MKVIVTYDFIEFLFKLGIAKYGQDNLILADVCDYIRRFER